MGSAPSKQRRPGSVVKSSEASLSPSVTAEDVGIRRHSIVPLDKEAKIDVMISYSHSETEQMTRLVNFLTDNGFVVWVDVVGLQAGVNFFDKIGNAIINARLFITLLSENAIKSKYCRDEISLAYVLNKPMFVVYIDDRLKLDKCMDMGMRLEFASLTWYNYTQDDISSLSKLIQDMSVVRNDVIHTDNIAKKARNPAKPLKRALTRNLLRSKSSDRENTGAGDDFWETHFNGKECLDPKLFMEKLDSVIGQKLEHFIKSDLDKRYIQRIVRRKLVRKGNVPKSCYDKFCQDELGRKCNFFTRIEEFVVERYAITQVFQVDSSVRLQTIENLGRYKSIAVVDALTELLDDNDSDARAVAAITLAKTGINNQLIKKSLIGLLYDEDRLVRESACLALGHLKVEEAVPELVKIWRTEVVSSVRDAAEIALKKVGGQEASQALHMVDVLTSEIHFLINN